MKLILIRGLPGAGKTTLAKTLSYYEEYTHLETDMYWGETYDFAPNRLKEAQEWCLNLTKRYLNNNWHVIVSNIFATKDELRPYFELAHYFGITPHVILCQGNFKCIHDVSSDIITNLKNRFEYDISDLFKEFGE